MKKSIFSKKVKRILVIVLPIIFIGAILIEVFVSPYFETMPEISIEADADWMGKVADDRLLSDIQIPGTHDSGSRYAEFPYVMRCQLLSISEQLDAGFRYLDIRLKPEGDGLAFYHSFAKCKTGMQPGADILTLDMVLAEIYDFLEKHPTETVVFVVKSEDGQADIADVQKRLNTYVQKNPDKWLLTDAVPKLEDARGKLVLFRRYDDKAGLGAKAGIALDWDDQGGEAAIEDAVVLENNEDVQLLVQDRYRYGIDDKLEVLNVGLDLAAQNAESGMVRINFLSTTGPNVFSHPETVAGKMNAAFKEMELSGNIGWVLFDYGNADLARLVYERNME